ncbi:MAG: aminopeptidase, partial [Gammaproteobacteria bacterium]
MRFPLLPAVLACALLAGCQRSEPAAPVSAPAPAPAADSVPAAPDKHVFEAAISAEDFRADITTLASDEFGGRAPGTQGETLTVEYLRDRFAAMGLQPGNGDRWFQTVPMVETTATPVAAAVKIRDKCVEWTFGSQWVAGTRTGEASVQV